MFEKEIGIIMDANDEKEIPAVVKQTVDAYDRIIKALEYEVIDTTKAIMQYRKLTELLEEEGTKIWTNHYNGLVTTLPPKGRELSESYSQKLFLLLRRRAS